VLIDWVIVEIIFRFIIGINVSSIGNGIDDFTSNNGASLILVIFLLLVFVAIISYMLILSDVP
jgi:hypothetical protein